jgi:poly-gamma-glutamate capsule biosynthesis protein CapA/YwtB (metallophosphatase superfamily)
MLHRSFLSLLLAVILAAGCRSQPVAFSSAQTLPTSEPLQTSTPVVSATSTPTTAPSSTPLSVTPTTGVQPSPTAADPQVTKIVFTGVIVPARCVQAAIDSRGDPDYLYKQVKPLISEADIAVGTLNATISDFPAHTGCISTYVLVGSSQNADALARAGFDVMSVATNHIKNCGISNCGERAFFDTLTNLRRVGILPVGAGEDHARAMQPVVIEAKGVRFGIVSLGHIEPMVFAGENTPGIAVLNQENIREAIAAARKVSDVIIAMPHWGPEDSARPTYIQRDLAQTFVKAGADLVVGNHTHVLQGLQSIDGVPVFYGLGNFVFDQTWALDHQQGAILEVTFEGQRYAGYELIPTHVDGDGTVHIAGPEEAGDILERVHQASQGLQAPSAH